MYKRALRNEVNLSLSLKRIELPRKLTSFLKSLFMHMVLDGKPVRILKLYKN